MKSHPPQSLPCVQDPAAHELLASDERDASGPSEESAMDNAIVELTNRLPTSELIRIIKGALECGRRNLPFTQTDLVRAMTIPPPAMTGGSGISPEFSGRAPRR